MKYSIPFGKKMIDVDLTGHNVIFCAEMMHPPIPEDVHVLIDEALNAPYGTPRLSQMVKPNSKIMVLCDDITRPTPKRLLLSHVVKAFEKAGVPDENILVCIAPGTHRPMTDQELLDNFGDELLSRFRFMNINYKETEKLINIGRSPSGIDIEVYKEALNADFILGIGNIVPHVSAGWGGGAKIVQPGICGEITTQQTHVIAALEQNVFETCGNPDNQCRREMELIAGQVGLKFIVNTVMDESGHVLGVFCGDFIKAHRAGVAFAKTVLCPKIPARADIVIASANPCEIDFWQGDKPFVFAQYGLKDNGTLIFVMAAQEGLCGNAPEHEAVLRKYCTLTEQDVRRDVERGVIEDLIGIDAPIHLDQSRKRGIKTILVSEGMDQNDAADLGFEWSPSLDAAMNTAFARHGSAASVGIIPYCGETLVQCEG